MIAKGARQLKSRYQGLLESINQVEVVIYVSTSRKLQILGQVALEDSFKNIRGDYDKTGYSFAVLELTDIFFKEGAIDPVFFDFLKTLLNEIEKVSEPKFVFWYFLLKLSSYLGFRPVFDRCGTCNRSIASEECVFSIREGSIICKKCGAAPEGNWSLSMKARKSLSDLQNLNHKRLASASFIPDEKFAYTEFLMAYLRYHSEEKLALSSLKIFT